MREDYVESSASLIAPSRVRRASWGAIFAGVFVTIALEILLTVLGTAIGFASINPLQQRNPAEGLGLASAIWMLVTGLVSVWIGACIAGRLSGGPRRADGLIHGIVSWSVSTLAMLLLVTSAAGAILGGAGSLVSQALGQQSGSQGGGDAIAALTEQIKGKMPQAGALLPPTGRTENQQTPGQLTGLAQQDPELAAALAKMESNGGLAKSTAEKDQVINLLKTKHNMDEQQANSLLTQWDQNFQQAKGQTEQKAREVGQTAAKGISQGAFWAFGALLLGLLAAAWGGWAGTASIPRATEVVSTPA